MMYLLLYRAIIDASEYFFNYNYTIIIIQLNVTHTYYNYIIIPKHLKNRQDALHYQSSFWLLNLSSAITMYNLIFFEYIS